MENAQIEDVARLLKSIAHPIRLKILCLLQDGELSVGDLLEVVGTTNGNLSQHLAILRHQGIIVSHKEANFIYNRIADPRILSLMRGMQSLFLQPRRAARRPRLNPTWPLRPDRTARMPFRPGGLTRPHKGLTLFPCAFPPQESAMIITDWIHVLAGFFILLSLAPLAWTAPATRCSSAATGSCSPAVGANLLQYRLHRVLPDRPRPEKLGVPASR